ncbi:hypothetical protein MMC22_008861 [Lobaria immixta]|nr:hypothetical protein [Lobaria immixta]
MTSPTHTYGPTCSLQAKSNAFTRRASEVSTDPPKIQAHFFYSSALPIDDPLTPVPPPSSSSSTGPSKVPPRPFSIYDNTALEEAWQIIQNAKHDKRAPEGDESHPTTDYETPRAGHAKTDSGVDNVNSTRESAVVGEAAQYSEDSSHGIVEHGEEMEAGTSLVESGQGAALVNADTQKLGDPHLTLCDDPEHIPFDHAMPIDSDEIGNDEFESGLPRRRHRSPFRRRDRVDKAKSKETAALSRSLPKQKGSGYEAPYGSSPAERDTTGTPFLRVPSRMRRSRSQSSRRSKHESEALQADGPASASEGEAAQPSHSRPMSRRFRADRSESRHSQPDDHLKLRTSRHHRSAHHRKRPETAYITVGISRLHVVELPDLRMGPIYWDPIHDVCSVVRGTWFYKDTMMPVETDVANQIEEGYEYMKPWTSTYVDELNSCLEIGAEAELKIVYRLWPVDDSSSDVRPATAKSKISLLQTATRKLQPDERARKHAIMAAENPQNRAAGVFDGRHDPIRLYAKSSLIYANARDAQILRPSQLPSVARGRRPLGAIRKGRAVGIPVVRGFDYKAWERLHPPSKRATTVAKARDGLDTVWTATPMAERDKSCGACSAEEERPKATDLVLVIHGIGQKLSERVESFHFTHAINAFRRQINVELEAEAVKPWLRPNLGGIMVLPINWRSTLKFEDGPEPDPNRRDDHSSKNQFTLKDITAESIPAVRNLISDVMLDIPYYLSHHKKKMVEAVVKEANRVYRLWCRNNPGFEETGRVHLIAHSLGSVMALDILSRQPTRLPKHLDLKSRKPRNDIFEFDTKSLFFCGSPAGFFLLLNRAPLLPRRGRDKPDADGEDLSVGLAGEAGTYGCLAVDNLYNVMHYNDPIAYRLNACVDVDYAASLQAASVPSATNTWMQSIGSLFRNRTIPPTKSTFGDNLDELPVRPLAAKLPSTLEMETHDFTREEIAEKRMYLLNDNGQIDYTLHSGGGPLEIQYLNMLGAHSSYWTLQDFVRFLVVEIGRKSGKRETMVAMKAVKRTRGKV